MQAGKVHGLVRLQNQTVCQELARSRRCKQHSLYYIYRAGSVCWAPTGIPIRHCLEVRTFLVVGGCKGLLPDYLAAQSHTAGSRPSTSHGAPGQHQGFRNKFQRIRGSPHGGGSLSAGGMDELAVTGLTPSTLQARSGMEFLLYLRHSGRANPLFLHP